MAARKVAGMSAVLLAIYVMIWRPEPLGRALDSVFVAAVFYLSVAFVSAYLIFGRRPVCFIDPAGKAVVITGCDSGFGFSLAQKLDSMGFQVFAGCLAPDREGARLLQKTCSSRLRVMQLDVTDDWHVRNALKLVKENIAEGGLWAVVNNAGIATFTEIEWCAVDHFQKIMDVNVLGVVRVTKAFLPLLRQSKGRVINVASLAGRFTLPAFAAYSMSKKACIAFSDALRQEMVKFDVSVVTIEPGLYRTPITQEQYLIDLNRKSWAETPTDIRADYGEEYFNAFLRNITEQMKRARPNVEEVVDLMVTAVCVDKPRHRYVPYWRSYLRSLVLSNCPAAVSDRVFKAVGVKVPPSAKTRTSSKSSSANSTPKTGSPNILEKSSSANNTPKTGSPNILEKSSSANNTPKTGSPNILEKSSSANSTPKTGSPNILEKSSSANSTPKTGSPNILEKSSSANNTPKTESPNILEKSSSANSTPKTGSPNILEKKTAEANGVLSTAVGDKK